MRKEKKHAVDISFSEELQKFANQYLSKGSKLLVEGGLKSDQWTDNNGQNKVSIA